MSAFLNTAIMAADLAGKSLVQASKRLDHLKIDAKGYNNLVSNADKDAEQIIIEKITTAYPDHAILAEESGQLGSESSEIVWVIDPLDGTFNFIHGFPHFAVSIACMIKGKFEHGVIFDPVRDEMFVASSGKGAYLRHMSLNNRLRVSKIKSVRGSLVSVSGGYDADIQKTMQDVQSKLTAERSVVRKTGSAALDLAYVAAGRLDGYLASNLSLWDYAAGVVIVREAGGIITDFSGQGEFMQQKNLVAAATSVTPELIKILEK